MTLIEQKFLDLVPANLIEIKKEMREMNNNLVALTEAIKLLADNKVPTDENNTFHLSKMTQEEKEVLLKDLCERLPYYTI